MANWNKLREPRLGVMLHYDASTSDKGAVEWLTKDPLCHVSYNWLILDDGQLVEIAPPTDRAWHAGICRSSDVRLKYDDANSAFYGISLAAGSKDVATPAAKAAAVSLVRTIFATHGWPLTDAWRIVGHSTEAWPRGRKIDPEGPLKWRPVLLPSEIRALIQEPALV